MIRALREWCQRRAEVRINIDLTQWERVESSLPFLAGLPQEQRERLRQLALRFLASKEWDGAAGMTLNADIQLTISLQACLPILNLGLDWYDGWVGIVVYPGDFVIPRKFMDEDGILHEFDDEVLGEAWEGGPVLLSWNAQDRPDDGINVVIHEFAHKIDMANGMADGLPPLHDSLSKTTWLSVMQAAYTDFCIRCDKADETPTTNPTDHGLPIDPYAAESPAEFFAVCSEVFFESPETLLQVYPEVYAQLKAFYRQDPAARLSPFLMDFQT